MDKNIDKIKQEIENKIRTDYRNGSFLPKDYEIKDILPPWLKDNLTLEHREAQQRDLEELESKINAYKDKLGL